jgi:hypothetical protein
MFATAIVDQKIYTEQSEQCVGFSVPPLGKFEKLRSTVQIPKFGIGDSVIIKDDNSISSHLIVNGIEVERCLRYRIAGYKILYKLGDEFGYSHTSHYEDELVGYEEWKREKNK